VRLVAAELLKAWTTPRTLFGILLAELAIIGLGAAGTVDSAASSNPLPPSFEQDLISVSSVAVFFAVLFGVLLITRSTATARSARPFWQRLRANGFWARKRSPPRS
jgi:ABC-type Fe3+-siderophore transport system permease subunit